MLGDNDIVMPASHEAERAATMLLQSTRWAAGERLSVTCASSTREALGGTCSTASTHGARKAQLVGLGLAVHSLAVAHTMSP